ncbi:MAG: (d)CMP kinase [Planctomycetota bacterium]|nr:(d)CMP kinase [Planctomycetota bacterium]
MRVIAIDGPAGVGKSTIARRLAERLGWAYLDSGALYRALTHAALQSEVALDDGAALAALARDLELSLEPQGVVRVDGLDVSAALRTPAVARGVSSVAAVPAVRAVMVVHQRRFAEGKTGVVAEGRDMGTVVFPDAVIKLFLDADPEERARRRLDQGQEVGPDADMGRVRADLEARDAQDRGRAVAPLAQAADAERLDTTQMTPDEVFEAVWMRVRSVIRP